MFQFYNDPNFSFNINDEGNSQNNQQTFYFTLRDGKPIKIGDGTFGVVYQVHNSDNELCAVKLLYNNQALSQIAHMAFAEDVIVAFCEEFGIDSGNPITNQLKRLRKSLENIGSLAIELKDLNLPDEQYAFLLNRVIHNPSSIAIQRFRFEMDSARIIRDKLLSRGLEHEFSRVINIKGGTKSFHSYPAYQTFRDKFEDLQMQVSNYALVMPLYKCTLKDLLERGFDRTKREIEMVGVKGSASEQGPLGLTGYHLLEQTNFEERISTILPYILDIAQGLKALHISGLCHHDLKPANIFIEQQGSEVRAVLGDLGLFTPQKLVNAATSNLHDTLPLGTRHYRSPEQKDYFDLCEAEVAHKDIDNSGRLTVVLTVSDPKFQDTIIEEGDSLIFSKDTSRTTYTIAKFDKSTDAVTITLKEKEGEDSLTDKIKPDKNTLVVLYKMPYIRTDLFGLGAIIFDMLTCGNSPERFYDNIRGYDTEETDITRIKELYQQVSSAQSSQPGLLHIFAPFKHNQDQSYAPDEIVELILKCMFYKAQNTFYRSNAGKMQNNAEWHKPIEDVLNQLKSLDNVYHGTRFDNILMNPSDKKFPPRQFSVLSKEIQELQNYPLSKLPLRLAQGIWYFRKIVRLVRNTLSKKSIFFSEMLPEKIEVKSDDLAFTYITYKQEEDYKDDLKEDLVYTRVSRDIAHPFVPNYLTFLRRKIRLKLIAENTCQYTFSGSSLLGNHLAAGDWIIIDAELWKIKSIADSQITLEHDIDPKLNLNIPENFEDEYLYYKDLDPSEYYLNMLGIYLYHIFFVGLGGATRDKPLIINIAQSLFYLGADVKEAKNKEIKIKKGDPKKELEAIFQMIARLYVRVTSYEGTGFYHQRYSNPIDRIISIEQEAQRIQDMIADFVNVMSPTLDILVKELNENEQLQRKVPQSFPDGLEFNSLILSFMDIPLKQKHTSLWENIPSFVGSRAK